MKEEARPQEAEQEGGKEVVGGGKYCSSGGLLMLRQEGERWPREGGREGVKGKGRNESGSGELNRFPLTAMGFYSYCYCLHSFFSCLLPPSMPFVMPLPAVFLALFQVLSGRHIQKLSLTLLLQFLLLLLLLLLGRSCRCCLLLEGP